MENKKKQLDTEKISYNYYPEESKKKQDLNQTEHLKAAKEHGKRENENTTQKESYNTLPGRDAE
ncbi:hypothetical protein MKX47_10090 [Solibacillus sp. FSL R7-0668]|uniref:hypothetical protein n=1 Tax=Solibacillus sp. FSL R7-0668 TaxID=2921688 RepID=UPI0030F5D215